MAEVDPALQVTNDPSYTRDSRGVDVNRTPGPEGVVTNQIMPRGVDTPDRSAEYLGKAAAYEMESSGASKKGLGDLFAGVVAIGDFAFKAGDALIKKDIERQVYDMSKREQENEITRLEGQLYATGKKSIFDANASADMPDEELPSDLQTLPADMARYREAADAKGNRAHYAAIVHREAKDLRAKYPMYAQYIDEQVKTFTGMDPANARIQAMNAQMNSAVTSRAQEQRRMISEVMKRNGYAANGVNSVQALNKIRTGEWTSMQDVANWAYPNDKKEADFKAKDQARKDYTGDREIKSQMSKDAAYAFLAKESDGLIENIMAGFEVKDVNELRMKLKEDRPVKWWQDRVVELETARDMFEKKMFAAMTAGGKDSMAVGMNLKPAEVKAYIKEFNAPFDSLIQSVKDKDANGISGAANRIKSKTDEAVEYFINAPGIREFALPAAAARQLFGDNTLVAQEFTERILNQQFGGRYKAALDTYATKLRSGAALGQTTSFQETFEAFKAKGALTRSDATKFVDMVSDIANPKVTDQEKYSIAVSAFGEGNRGFIKNQIAAKDQWGTFNKWTADGIAKEVKRLDAKYPGLWNQYVNWAEQTMTSDLLASDIKTLNQIDKEKNFDVQWSTSANGIREIKFIEPAWKHDDGTNRQLQRHVAGGGLPREKELTALENRFNSALRRYSIIANESGQDPDAFILRSLHNGGLLNKPGDDLQSTFSNKLFQSLKNSRIKTEVNRNAGR